MKKTILLAFIFLAINSSAQEFLENKLIEYYKNDDDLIYTQLNKNHFIEGEVVWFKNYFIDRKTSFLKKEVSNLYLSILDSDYQLVDQAVYHVKNGMSNGQYEIDRKFTTGRYYFIFSTNYNNHNQLQHLNHQLTIEVIDKIDYQKPKRELSEIDFQILPESGHGLFNYDHQYGVKAIDKNGMGVIFEAEIYKNDKKIITFKSNDVGLASFKLNPNKKDIYTLKAITENNVKVNQKIDLFETTGALISTKLHPDGQIITLQQNLSEVGFKDFNLIVHQAGKHFEIDLSHYSDDEMIQIKLSNSQLFTGVNAITLFYKKQPIAERLIFKHQDNYLQKEDIHIEDKFSPAYDSIQVQLNSEKLDEVYSYLSLSVLPKNTIAHHPNQNIFSKILLSPYLKGNIENPNLYFEDKSFTNQYNLDLLLLTQGWSRYNWEAILNQQKIDRKYREDGLEQEIIFLTKTNNFKRFLLVKENLFNEDEVFDLKKTKSIKTNKIFPVEDEAYKFYTFSKKGKHYLAPKFKINTKINYPEIEVDKSYLNLKREMQYQKQLEINDLEDVELLDDVLVVAKKESSIEDDRSLKSLRDDKVTVDEDLVQQFPYLSDYLRYRGFLVIETGASFQINNNRRGVPPPLLFLGDARLSDLSVLNNARTSDFETIDINKLGFGGGMQGSGGVIKLEYRKNMLFTDQNNRYSTITMANGYKSPKEFYNPEYSNYSNNEFQLIASLHWEPYLISKDGEFKFEMPNLNFSKFKFFLEGITEKGDLISIPINYELKSKMFDH